MSNLPKQIRDQIAEANETMRLIGLDPDAPPAEGDPPADPAIQPEPATPPAEPPAAIQPEPPPPAEPQPPVVTPPSNPPEDNNFKAMKGRYEAAAADLVRAQAEIVTLRERLAKKPDIAPLAQPVAVPADFELTAQERADYGEDFVRVIEKRAQAAVHAQLTELRGVTEQLRRKLDGVETTTAVDARTRMYQSLDSLEYDWKAINASDHWKEWLAQPDPLSGAIRNELLLNAFERNDAQRVRRFFDGYLQEAAGVPPARQPTPGAAPPARAPAVDLAALAAPGSARSAAGAGASPAEKPVFTAAQIGSFYSDLTSGKYKGREAEKTRMQAAINEAVAEGRVRG